MAKSKLPEGLWKRGGTYYARFRKNGKLVRKKLSKNLTVAKQALNLLRVRADQADFGIVDNDYPWDELKEAFLAYIRQHVRHPDDHERNLRRFEQYQRVTSVRQITPSYVVGFRKWRLQQDIEVKAAKKLKASLGKKVSPRTVNREVGALSVMLTWAAGEEGEKRIGYNPIAGVKPLPHDHLRKQRRALTVDEVYAIFAASPPHLLPVFKMYAITGMRRNELVGLRFSDIDFRARTITITKGAAKNHKERQIPLDDEAVAMLRDLQQQAPSRKPHPGLAARFSRDHVFVTTVNTPLKNNLLRAFYSVCKRAGIEGAESGGSVDLHSLRVTFASLALENGATPKAVQDILGHATLDMTMNVYAKVAETAKRDALAVLPFRRQPTAVEPIPQVSAPPKQVKPLRTERSPPKPGPAQTSFLE